MKSQRMRALSFALAMALTLIAQTAAKPAVTSTSRRGEQPPKLVDTLAVAKSPLEPVTLANNQPDARNDGRQAETTTVALELDEGRRQTTRSADQLDEQQQGVSSTKGLDESSGLPDAIAAGSTQSLATEKPDEVEAAMTTSAIATTTETTPEPATDAETAKAGDQADEPTTTQAPAEDAPPNKADSQPPPPPEAPASTTTTTQEPTTTTTTEVPTTTTTTTTTSSAPEKAATIEAELATTTTTTTSTTTTPAAPAETTSEEMTTTEGTQAPTSEVPAEPPTTTTAPSVAPLTDPANESTSSPPVTTPTSTTTTSQPETEAPAPTQADNLRDQPPAAPPAPTTTTTVAPETTTTTTTTSAEVKPASSQATSVETSPRPSVPASVEHDKNATDQGQKPAAAACNHLPTYNTDEIQKVFREETTFKNGTIKGKFTYINFDQRYRLVHYTRLPYGPVKIDQVEELGRPKQSDSQPAGQPTLSEVPNAVLQLRNLLPNSMFGFPFLGPNAAGQLRPREGGDLDDKSSMYFYSTDSLATPNLLTPRVPLSLLPGQQRVKILQTPFGASADPLASAALNPSTTTTTTTTTTTSDQQAVAKPFGMPTPSTSEPKSLDRAAEGPNPSPSAATNPAAADLNNLSHFHFANTLAGQQPDSKSFVYSYFNSQPLHHYRYSPLSTAPLFQPFAQARHQHFYQPAHHPLSLADSQATLAHQAHHQPHSHEHFMAQYMLTQPPSGEPSTSSSAEANNDSSRLRLRVKTAKSLSGASQPVAGTKSAQLRLRPSEGHFSSPVNSPMHMMHSRNQQQQQQQHRRLGKQSQQLKARPTNPSPVVYHVLRNPSGQVYTHYNQGYAVAYDHE